MTNLILVTNARGNSVEILPALSLLNHSVDVCSIGHSPGTGISMISREIYD